MILRGGVLRGGVPKGIMILYNIIPHFREFVKSFGEKVTKASPAYAGEVFENHWFYFRNSSMTGTSTGGLTTGSRKTTRLSLCVLPSLKCSTFSEKRISLPSCRNCA